MCHCRIPPFYLRLLQRVRLRKNFFSLPTWNRQVRFKMACKDVWNIYNVRKQYSSPRSWLKERRVKYVRHSAGILCGNIWSHSKAKFQDQNLGPLLQALVLDNISKHLQSVIIWPFESTHDYLDHASSKPLIWCPILPKKRWTLPFGHTWLA